MKSWSSYLVMFVLFLAGNTQVHRQQNYTRLLQSSVSVGDAVSVDALAINKMEQRSFQLTPVGKRKKRQRGIRAEQKQIPAR